MQTSHPAVVVSIHDVSPLTRDTVAAMLDDLAAVGVTKTSLLVIPNHHHRAPVTEDPGFCGWVGDQVRNGQEVVLHGYYHLRPRQAGQGARSLVTECYTAGEGEFFDLPEAEAAARLQRARAEFAAVGWDPVGFIAPAWLLGPEAEEAVRKAGFAYTTRLRTFKDLRTRKETVSQSLVWSVRSGWRRQASLGWNCWLAGRLARNPLLRVGLHPPDWSHPAIRRQALELIRAALAGRDVLTYDGWLARQAA